MKRNFKSRAKATLSQPPISILTPGQPLFGNRGAASCASYQSAWQQFGRGQIEIKSRDLVFAAIGVALGAISALPVFNINLGFMRVGITYVWPVMLGLTVKPLIAITTAIIGDNLALVASGVGLSQGMIEYAIIYPLITLTVSFLKWLIMGRYARYGGWWCVTFCTLSAGAVLVILLFRDTFTYNSSNADSFFNFQGALAKGIVGGMFGLLTSCGLALSLYYYKVARHKPSGLRLKRLLMLGTIILVIIVIFIGAGGPFAQVRYLSVGVNPGRNYYAQYDLYLIPRILKTPFSMALGLIILAPLYGAHLLIVKRRESASQG